MSVRAILAATMLGLSAFWAVTVAAQSVARDYALRLPVTVSPNSSLQRLALPTQALAGSRSPGLADVRVFDSAGTAAPMTLIDASGDQRSEQIRLPAMPIYGRPDGLHTDGVVIVVEGRGARLVVEGPTQPTLKQAVLGVLFDTRGVADPAAELSLDIHMPAMRLMTFVVESSSNLRDWRQVGARTLYGGGAPDPINLNGVVLKGQYLRLTWSAEDPVAAGAVAVRQAVLKTRRWAAPNAAPRVRLINPRIDGDALIFSAPPAAPLMRAQIKPPKGAVITPVRLLGRSGPEAPWTVIGAYVVRNLIGQSNAVIDLNGLSYDALRIEPDKRGTPLGAQTEIELSLTPQELLFVASGKGPYTLAVGRPGAPSAYLANSDVLPDMADIAAAQIATTPGQGSTVVLDAAQSARPATRDIVLWAVLAAAALALMAMVAVLWRGRGLASKPDHV